jgi:flagellar basal body-associated protein FliL
MSDSNVEEESLISQDDIDKLLDSSSSEEAEEKLETGNDSNTDMDELGELSQDDIDNLLNGSTLDAKAGAIEEDPLDEDMGELSQGDIDSLMSKGSEMGSEMGSDTGDDEDMELISQDDIDRLMNPSANEALLSPENEDISPGDFNDPDELISVEDDYVINASEAFDVSDCLVTQETMDELIRNAPGTEEISDSKEISDPVVLDAEVESEPVAQVSEEPMPEELEEDDLSMEASSDELEELIEEDVEFDWENQDNDDVSQDDIDALLLEDPDDNGDILEDEDDILISQDDIDTLLTAADPDDEDVLGDFMGDDMDVSLDDDFDDEDILDSDDISEHGGDQVVLERLDDAGAGEDKSSGSGKGWKNWYKSRMVIAAASAILVLGISVPTVYFLFFSKDPAKISEQQMVPLVLEEQGRDVEVTSVDIDAKATPEIKKPGTILLKDFVVLSSELSKDMAYVTADISIDYSDQRAYHEINNNLSFYRDLIYESIQKSLVWEKRNEITQADIVWGVEASLKKVLPPHYIKKVSFKSFNAS